MNPRTARTYTVLGYLRLRGRECRPLRERKNLTGGIYDVGCGQNLSVDGTCRLAPIIVKES